MELRSEEKKDRILMIDIIRAVSAILVILYHYTTRYDQSIGHIKPYAIEVPWGHMAVSSFFLLSGFLVIMHIKDDETIFSFAYKRVIRLYPSYLISICITTMICMMLLPERVLSIKEIIVNFSMFQNFVGVNSVDGAYWTLSLELLFYSIIALLIYIKQTHNIVKISFVWSTLSIIINILDIENKFMSIVSVILITNYAQTFIIGIMMYRLYINNKQFLPHFIILICIINHYICHGLEYTLFLIGLVGIFYAISYKVAFLQVKYVPAFIKFIARISYPLYLTHQYIGFGIIRTMELNGLTSEFYIIIPIGITILLSYVINKFVEIPSINYFNKINHLNKRLKNVKI